MKLPRGGTPFHRGPDKVHGSNGGLALAALYPWARDFPDNGEYEKL